MVLGEGIRLESWNLGLCWCLWLRYVNGFGYVPYICKKVRNNTKMFIGWWNKAGIPKFVIYVYVGVCGYDMEVGLEMCPIFVRRLLINIKIGIGWRV